VEAKGIGVDSTVESTADSTVDSIVVIGGGIMTSMHVPMVDSILVAIRVARHAAVIKSSRRRR